MKEVKWLWDTGIIPWSNSYKEYRGFVFDKSVPVTEIDNSKVKDYFEKLIIRSPMDKQMPEDNKGLEDGSMDSKTKKGHEIED